MMRTILLWTATIVLTLASVVYQRLTGPTQAIRDSVTISGTEISYKLLRTHDNTHDARIEISVPDTTVTGRMTWRRFKSHDTLATQPMVRLGESLIARIPKQPAAGKVVYRIALIDSAGAAHDLSPEPVIIRFKGPVPSYILFPHVLIMFSGMALATRTGLQAIFRRERIRTFSLWTLGLLLVGGLIFGPIMQKFAFGQFWTGWPVGHDLTDNKTAVAVLFWFVALWRMSRSQKGRGWVIVASVVTLIIFVIPHSLLGSELDYRQME